jgi:hypothetical protein
MQPLQQMAVAAEASPGSRRQGATTRAQVDALPLPGFVGVRRLDESSQSWQWTAHAAAAWPSAGGWAAAAGWPSARDPHLLPLSYPSTRCPEQTHHQRSHDASVDARPTQLHELLLRLHPPEPSEQES